MLVGLAACASEVDPPWQLSHDRIIAVRATPPHLAHPGDTSAIDGLLGFQGAPPVEASPDTVAVTSPKSLASVVSTAGGTWTVTAPADLAAARTELGLAADAPVPVQLDVYFARDGFTATKTVVLGDAGENPTLVDVTIDGHPPVAPLAVAAVTDIPLSITADDTTEGINWLSSCGTVHDYDLASAYLRVDPTDPQSGELGVVLRDGRDGVAWQFWPIAVR